MEKQVQFRDRQELQSADLNNIQAYTADSLQHLVQDAVTKELAFTGGHVAVASATEITVSTLRFYNDGRVYVSETPQTLNLFQHLPLVTQKCIAVVVWGQGTDTLTEPRDFLIDLTTGATQPQAVAMQRLNAAQINLLPGAESVDPQPPAIQSGALAIAYVYLTPTGVDRVEMRDAVRLPNVGDHAQRVRELEGWKAQAEPRIGSIATDLSALASKTMDLAPRSAMYEMAADIGRLKAQLNLPATYGSYQSDAFMTADLTDSGQDGYTARVDNGLLFPFAAQAKAPLALFNPYDAGLHRTADGLVLPAFDAVPRIRTSGYGGDISISQYQVQSQELRPYTITKMVRNYGTSWNNVQSWWSTAYMAQPPHARVPGYPVLYHYSYWRMETETHYELMDVTTSYNGALIAQTVLVANAMWLTHLGLSFTQIGQDGEVQVAICETDVGKPNLQKTLALVTVPVASLKKYPLETVIDIPPVYLEAGTRYAIVLITQGDHRCAVVSGNDYTQGTLFYGSDGDYFSGDLTKDLMFTLYGAKFRNPRTEVMLQPVSLAGGISDISINVAAVEPAGAALEFEIQIGGRWYLFGDEVFRLADLPDIVPLRAVLLGTSDTAPALQMAPEVITASRPAITLTHYSTLRSLASPSSAIQVQIALSRWDDAHHSLSCALVSGATSYTPAVTSSKVELDGTLRVTFSFTADTPLESYRVKLTGSRAAGATPFVIVERTDIAS
ncbi:hypothetical protein [Stutzerimonas kunmingensis]|uniref:hypothetical protein n=1 Tax=Stutzerimonas kunmingensis TaxID=1211807 RepID=UPI0028ACDD6B|nr:hypothetical protein [Stutzerimonas kunmingensis]